MRSSALEIKSKLIEDGKIFIPKDIAMPCFASRSTAGPDAGVSTYAFEFNGSRIKLEVSKDPGSKYCLREDKDYFSILENSAEFLKGVRVLPTMAHSPNQAFINLTNKCIYGCRFCSAPAMERDIVGEMTPERVLRIVNIASLASGFEAISITSGVPDSPTQTNHRLAEMTRTLKENHPEFPIGVEAYFEHPYELEMLKNSGADEIKINIEVWPKELFKVMCPKRSRKAILEALEQAVGVFGRGKVTSNIIIGLGETDEEVEEGVVALAKMGVVANVRAIRINGINEPIIREGLEKLPEKVSAERLQKLAHIHKAVLEKHGLTTKTFRTMCFSCQCCDIVPMRDL